MTTQENALSQSNTENTEPVVQLTRLDELEIQFAQAQASQFAVIAKMFATDPASASLKMQQLNAKSRADAQVAYDAEKATLADKAKAQAVLVTAYKVQACADMQALWNTKLVQGASKFDSVKRWTFIVERDESVTDKIVFKPVTVIDGTVKVIKTGATKDVVGGGSQVITVSGGPNNMPVTSYASHSKAKVEVLGKTTPMNAEAIRSALTSAGYTIQVG